MQPAFPKLGNHPRVVTVTVTPTRTHTHAVVDKQALDLPNNSRRPTWYPASNWHLAPGTLLQAPDPRPLSRSRVLFHQFGRQGPLDRRSTPAPSELPPRSLTSSLATSLAPSLSLISRSGKRKQTHSGNSETFLDHQVHDLLRFHRHFHGCYSSSRFGNSLACCPLLLSLLKHTTSSVALSSRSGPKTSTQITSHPPQETSLDALTPAHIAPTYP